MHSTVGREVLQRYSCAGSGYQRGGGFFPPRGDCVWMRWGAGFAKCRGFGVCSPGCNNCGALTHWSCCGDSNVKSADCLPEISKRQAEKNGRRFRLSTVGDVAVVCADIPGVMFSPSAVVPKVKPFSCGAFQVASPFMKPALVSFVQAMPAVKAMYTSTTSGVKFKSNLLSGTLYKTHRNELHDSCVALRV